MVTVVRAPPVGSFSWLSALLRASQLSGEGHGAERDRGRAAAHDRDAVPAAERRHNPYLFENVGSFRVSVLTEGSSFVLSETGAFYLQYEAFPQRAWGRYEREDGRIAFYFSERSKAADAIGTIKANLLEVRYSEIMQHSDFENAVYERVE